MRRIDARFALGLLLLFIGVLLLLQNLGVTGIAWNALWSLLFTAAGLAFLALSLESRDRWWAVIPGFTLLGLGALIGLQVVAPHLAARWGGSIFLGSIGLGFFAVYLARWEHWWAIIPGGVLLTLAAVAGLSGVREGEATGGIFFLGLGLTFGLVYLLPSRGGRRGRAWSLIPAGVLLVFGLALLTATRAALGYLWPLLLILAGLFLVYRALRSQRSG